MPRAALQLIPGVDQNETQALNQAAISECNLIRFIYDKKGQGLVQKLGGWTAYYPQPIQTITRALWAWEDTNAVQYLALGNQASTSNLQSSLQIISNSNLTTITPRTLTTNPSLNFSTVSGSSTVTIIDSGISTSSFDTVFISTQVSIGGLILSGFYPVTVVSGTTYTIQALSLLGTPALATSTVSNAGAVPQYTTTNSSSIITVTLANHGYAVGGTYSALLPTVFNGVTIFGNYTVQSVPSTSTFTIQASTTANAASSVYENGGYANLVYYIGFGPVPAGTGYGVGGYGSGGYGSGTAITPTTGTPIYTNDWTIDNFGQIMVACPVPALNVVLNSVSTVGKSGSSVTFTFSTAFTVPVGNLITVTGMSVSAYNGTYSVSSSTSTSVTVAYSGSGSGAASGGVITTIDPASGPIFYWDPTSGATTATVMSYAPPVNDGIFVAMPQRQIVAWGSTFTGIPDPLLIRWCDVQNFNSPGSWIAQSTNQAGSYRLPKGSKIVGCLQGPQQALVWTDLAIWSMQYIGQPYIYAFNEIAVGTGMIARKAAGSFNGVVYWMGPTQFYQLSGGGVTPIACPVWDVIFQDLDETNLQKIRCAVNSRFAEVSWYYPTLSSGGEVTAYVKYNTMLQTWDYGQLGRSAWINESVLGPPIGADPSQLYIYQHETSPDAANGTQAVAMNSYFQTGYFAISEADMKTYIDQIWPDAKWGYFNGTTNPPTSSPSATLNITFYVADYPGATPQVFGPYPVTQATTWLSPRFRGRLVSVFIGSTDTGTWWRIGNMRYRYSPDGKF